MGIPYTLKPSLALQTLITGGWSALKNYGHGVDQVGSTRFPERLGFMALEFQI